MVDAVPFKPFTLPSLLGSSQLGRIDGSLAHEVLPQGDAEPLPHRTHILLLSFLSVAWGRGLRFATPPPISLSLRRDYKALCLS